MISYLKFSLLLKGATRYLSMTCQAETAVSLIVDNRLVAVYLTQFSLSFNDLTFEIYDSSYGLYVF